MVKKKVDPRVQGLIEHNIRKNHRSFFVLVGDHGKDQVENLHRIVSKMRVKARPSVLWCYKKELGFSTHRKKRIKEIKKSQARGLYDPERDDPFELFISSTDIRWTYYKETDKILGQTFGMCVLQDFEALTPNLLARTIETVEGGGLVILLMKTVKSLKQLYSITMDVHSRYRTEAHHEVVPRFNERFILTLADCDSCLVLDDELNILPISSKVEHIPTYDSLKQGFDEGDINASGVHVDPELTALKTSLAGTKHVGHLVELTKTIDQAQAVMSFLDAVSEKTLRSTVSLTAGRGRGKSAAIGLCLAGAIAFGYSNVFVTAPSPENLKTVFEFLISGLKALKYTEHLDFEIIQENMGEVGKVVTRVNIFRDHRQTVQYVLPSDHVKLSQAELVAIDEAAAIPLPVVRKLMGPYLTFLSSTINGYEGTGRSLSLKLIQQLRAQQHSSAAAAALQAGDAVAGPKNNNTVKRTGERNLHEQRWKVAADAAKGYSSSGASGGTRALVELSLNVPIRYAEHDPVEKWLNNLLCMDVTANTTRMLHVMPAPRDCELYIVNRDALFSYHALSEALLQRIWALYTAAHYKNSPNDLQMLSDAPSHRLFVLLGPQRNASTASADNNNAKTNKRNAIEAQLPEVLCVVQVAFEGMISQRSVQSELSKGNKASGDLIPWTISQQFNDSEFATLSGVRIVRIATHPDVQKMGYGSRAVDLLVEYFQGNLTIDSIDPSTKRIGGEGEVTTTANTGNETSTTLYTESTQLHEESVTPKPKLPALLTPISNRPAERLHWIGSSFGLTAQLLGFWSRKHFKVCYVRQTTNDLTGEYSCIVLRELDSTSVGTMNGGSNPAAGWVQAFVHDYRRRLLALMHYSFRSLDVALSITLLDPDRKLTAASTGVGAGDADESNQNSDESSNVVNTLAVIKQNLASNTSLLHNSSVRATTKLSVTELLALHFTHHDLQRLELYARNMVDHHMILDLIPTVTKLIFQGKLPQLRFSYLQIAILLAIGLQCRDVDSISSELDLPASQVLALFNKTIRKIASTLREMIEADTAAQLLPSTATALRMEQVAARMTTTLADTLQADQKEDEAAFQRKQRELIMNERDLARHSLEAVDKNKLDSTVLLSQKKQGSVPSIVSLPNSATASAAVVESAGSNHKKRKDGVVTAEKVSKKHREANEIVNAVEAAVASTSEKKKKKKKASRED